MASLAEVTSERPGAAARLPRPLLAVVMALLVPILLLPGLINGAPLLFPDSIGYFHAGDAAVDKVVGRFQHTAPGTKAGGLAGPGHVADGEVSTSRSVYYGILYDGTFRLAGEWALPLLQVAAVLLSLHLALRRLASPGPLTIGAVIVLLALPAGLAAFASSVMPDVFAGLMILGLALLLGDGRTARGERVWWLAMLLAACLFHKSHVAVAAALVTLWALWALARRRDLLRRALGPALAIMVGWLGHAAVDRAVQAMTGKPVASTPFLLARLVDDGSAIRYLDAHCPSPTIRLCGERARLPMSDAAFLWSRDPRTGLFLVLSPADRARVAAEAGPVVAGTIREFPGEVLADSTRNFVAQLGKPGVTEFAVGPKADPAGTPRLRDVLTGYRDTLVGQRQMPLKAMSLVMTLTYIVSFPALAAALWQAMRQRLALPHTGVIALLMLGVVVNAGVCGVLAGVYDRYQGRVAWLVPLAAVIAWSALYHQRSGRAAKPAARSIA